MEPPSKRPRYDSPRGSDDYDTASRTDGGDAVGTETEDDYELQRSVVDDRFQSAMAHIFEKYGRNFDGVGDEIDMMTGNIVVDNGHLSNMRNETDVGAAEHSDKDSVPTLADANGEGSHLRLEDWIEEHEDEAEGDQPHDDSDGGLAEGTEGDSQDATLAEPLDDDDRTDVVEDIDQTNERTGTGSKSSTTPFLGPQQQPGMPSAASFGYFPFMQPNGNYSMSAMNYGVAPFPYPHPAFAAGPWAQQMLPPGPWLPFGVPAFPLPADQLPYQHHGQAPAGSFADRSSAARPPASPSISPPPVARSRSLASTKDKHAGLTDPLPRTSEMSSIWGGERRPQGYYSRLKKRPYIRKVRRPTATSSTQGMSDRGTVKRKRGRPPRITAEDDGVISTNDETSDDVEHGVNPNSPDGGSFSDSANADGSINGVRRRSERTSKPVDYLGKVSWPVNWQASESNPSSKPLGDESSPWVEETQHTDAKFVPAVSPAPAVSPPPSAEAELGGQSAEPVVQDSQETQPTSSDAATLTGVPFPAVVGKKDQTKSEINHELLNLSDDEMPAQSSFPVNNHLAVAGPSPTTEGIHRLSPSDDHRTILHVSEPELAIGDAKEPATQGMVSDGIGPKEAMPPGKDTIPSPEPPSETTAPYDMPVSVKRGPGRPRKSENRVGAQLEVPNQSPEASGGRGIPGWSSDASEGPESIIVKRGPGRPRKSDATTGLWKANESYIASPLGVQQPLHAVQGDEKVSEKTAGQKRGPGRPRKYDPGTSTGGHDDVAMLPYAQQHYHEAEMDEDFTEDDNEVDRRSKRPRKSEPTSTIGETTATDSDVAMPTIDKQSSTSWREDKSMEAPDSEVTANAKEAGLIKRGPGRPRASTAEAKISDQMLLELLKTDPRARAAALTNLLKVRNSPATAKDLTTPTDEPKVSKRGPGRPPKNRADHGPLDSGDEYVPQEAGSVPKSGSRPGPGRPRKQLVERREAGDQPHRGPGRPRKSDIQETTKLSASNEPPSKDPPSQKGSPRPSQQSSNSQNKPSTVPPGFQYTYEFPLSEASRPDPPSVASGQDVGSGMDLAKADSDLGTEKLSSVPRDLIQSDAGLLKSHQNLQSHRLSNSANSLSGVDNATVDEKIVETATPHNESFRDAEGSAKHKNDVTSSASNQQMREQRAQHLSAPDKQSASKSTDHSPAHDSRDDSRTPTLSANSHKAPNTSAGLVPVPEAANSSQQAEASTSARVSADSVPVAARLGPATPPPHKMQSVASVSPKKSLLSLAQDDDGDELAGDFGAPARPSGPHRAAPAWKPSRSVFRAQTPRSGTPAPRERGESKTHSAKQSEQSPAVPGRTCGVDDYLCGRDFCFTCLG